MSKKFNLRIFNNCLSAVVILIGMYIIAAPFAPELNLWWKRLRDKSGGVPYSGQLAETSNSDNQSPKAEPPKDNRLVIPSIKLNEPIKEGSNLWVINDGGTWRRPGTSKPNKNGNTVIVGHRFYYSAPAPFYHLDKVDEGQTLAVYWEGVEHVYRVSEKRVVDPSQIEIEKDSPEPQLTLYTCHPLWTAKQRLVIIAKPVEDSI
jgi:LPXTG-site transpeptidase (sortase) family protein